VNEEAGGQWGLSRQKNKKGTKNIRNLAITLASGLVTI
jgi:hypothetical protein